jgi:CMP-N-acetylneuraminic acid synthetase
MPNVAFIPARGGSKGLPGKNLELISGRSLLDRAIDVAKQVEAIDEIVVSSDDNTILQAARRSEAETDLRLADLASDNTSTLEVVLDFLERNKDFSSIVVLQPTSPLRSPTDVEACLEALSRAPAAATVTEIDHPTEWTFTVDGSNRLHPIQGWDRFVTRRQESQKAYKLNGAVYAADVGFLRAGNPLIGPQTVSVEMPRERSIDIDDWLDLEWARAVDTVLQERVAGSDRQ